MNEKQLSRVMGHLAKGLVPGSVDLWPVIRERFESSKQHSIKGDLSMNNPPNIQARSRLNKPLRLAGLSTLALLILAGLVYLTPQGQAWAQEALRFFTRSGSDTLPIQSWQLTPLPTPGTPTPDPASILDVHQTVGEVEQLAGFKVLQPTRVPDVLSLVGASYQPDHTIARVFYRDPDSNSLVLEQEPFQRSEDCALCGTVGASASVETVKIGVVSGEYVEGVWKLTDKGPVWESDPFQKTLRWQVNNTAFEIRYMGIPDSLTKADLIAIAESVK